MLYNASAPPIRLSVMVTANLNAPLMVGQNYILTCEFEVTGAHRLSPTITYQWTTNNEMVPDPGNSTTLTLSPLQLSHAGKYGCIVIVSSVLLNNNISDSSSTRTVMIQSE